MVIPAYLDIVVIPVHQDSAGFLVIAVVPGTPDIQAIQVFLALAVIAVTPAYLALVVILEDPVIPATPAYLALVVIQAIPASPDSPALAVTPEGPATRGILVILA